MLHTYEQHSKTKLIATVLSVLVVAGSVLLADHFRTDDDATASAATSSQTSPAVTPMTTATPAMAATSTMPSSSAFKDGSYTASSDYYVPHGNENIQVSLTLKNGVITNSVIQNSEGDRESAAYQQSFASVYKSYVVGKKISDLKLGVVSGASDTSQGFNDALSQIASKAQA